MADKPNPYIRFMGMAGQMLAPIIVGIFAGKYLDKTFDTGKTWSAILTLTGVFGGMYLVIKEIMNISKDK